MPDAPTTRTLTERSRNWQPGSPMKLAEERSVCAVGRGWYCVHGRGWDAVGRGRWIRCEMVGSDAVVMAPSKARRSIACSPPLATSNRARSSRSPTPSKMQEPKRPGIGWIRYFLVGVRRPDGRSSCETARRAATAPNQRQRVPLGRASGESQPAEASFVQGCATRASPRTTTTGQLACSTQWVLTEPISMPEKRP